MKVFISHAKEDGPIAAQWKDLLTNLTSDFIEVWFFSDVSRDGGVPGGVEWRNALVAELKQSSAIIAIITPQGKYSPWIYWECGVAVGTDHQRLVFPICYKMAISDAPGPLNGYQVFNGCDEIDVKRVCQEILRIDNKDPKEKTLQPLIKDYLSNIDKILIGHRILSYEPHKGYVNDVDWVGNESGSFVSVSDDATIKITPFRDVGLSNSVVVCEINRIKCGCYIRELGGLIYGMLPGEVKYLALTPPYDAMVILYQHPAVRTIAFDKSGKCIATGGYNKELCIYKLDLSNLSVKELIRTQYRAARQREGVRPTEFMHSP